MYIELLNPLASCAIYTEEFIELCIYTEAMAISNYDSQIKLRASFEQMFKMHIPHLQESSEKTFSFCKCLPLENKVFTLCVNKT